MEGDESEESKNLEKHEKLIDTVWATMQQFGFTQQRTKAILRLEYNLRYKLKNPSMLKNRKIAPFEQRVNRMLERLKEGSSDNCVLSLIKI